MKTMTMIAATLIATAGLGTVAQAQQTQPMLTGQEKAVRYQEDQRQKAWDEQRMQRGEAAESSTFGAPNRQSFGRSDAGEAAVTEAPSNFSVPGSDAAMYSYDSSNKSWAYGY
ncbi:hypothetical protein [Aureimonas sp. SK2]|uniref:hypothetical protein n=1 Tax=Aureimonas sp. SK2 TaxID=3015992 RepID=UPI002444858C|nr:hypothetical protein [Aureimonas sp. SK2]